MLETVPKPANVSLVQEGASESASARLDAIPRTRFGFYPTPIVRMRRLEERLGANGPRLFIKHDDYLGPGFGGNKLRKLEFAMAAELARGTTAVVTIGGARSNHARVTAAVSARFGLKCFLVLDGSEPVDDLQLLPATQFVYEKFGARICWVSSRAEREPRARALLDELNDEGEQASYLPLGLSFPLGALGYVQAYREAMEQLAPVGVRVDHMFHSTSSGGTQAGLVAGNELFGHDGTQIVGVSADDPRDTIVKKVAEIVDGVFGELDVVGVKADLDSLVVLDGFIGEGYGAETDASREATTILAETEGVLLDPVYTSKAMAAMIDWIRVGRFDRDQTVLFWHTGGQLAHFYARTP